MGKKNDDCILSKDLRNYIADCIERYIDIREQCLISDTNRDEYEEEMKKARKLVKKIRKGDMEVFNMEVLEEELPKIEKEYENHTRFNYR